MGNYIFLSYDNMLFQLLMVLLHGHIVTVHVVQINNLHIKFGHEFLLVIHLSISPDEVCPGVAGVMDHHQLLAQAAVTATRGAEGVIVQEGDGEQCGQDVEGHNSDKDDMDKDRVIE